MLVIVNEKNVREAVDKLCGIADGLSLILGDRNEYVWAIDQVEHLLRDSIKDLNQQHRNEG